MMRRTINAGVAALASLVSLAAVPAIASADPGVVGKWGPLQQYPVVPVSMGVTPDGKIVAWDQANKPPHYANLANSGPAMILDPQTGSITRSTNIAPRQTFCPLITSLPDGRLAIVGGGIGPGPTAHTDVQIYDGDSKTFSVAGQMQFKRYYPGGTIDNEGNPIVAGGSSKGIERVDYLTGQTTLLDSTFPADWYPDLIRTPTGGYLIEDVGADTTAGPARFMLTGNTLSTVSDTAHLKEKKRAVKTLIAPHTMLFNSGGILKETLVIDTSGPSPTYTQVAPSRFTHATGTAVTLPTGDVLAVGGNGNGGSKGKPTMTPEIYSPAADTWTSMADLTRRRTYHSVAGLLPDGRVWSAGSSFQEIQEPNGQFFSPPYLFRKDGSGELAPRPTATDAPSSVAAGQSFSVATDNPTNIAHASFIRLAATTHSLNAGQAFVELPVTPGAGRVEMTAPSVDEAPPGNYMVFLVNKQGVPSIAPVLRLDASAGAIPQPRVTQSSQFDRGTAAWNAYDGDTSQAAGSKFSRTLSEPEPWWQVDLGESRNLENLTVRFRTDCCNTENRDLWVFASDQPFGSTTVNGLRSQPNVSAVRLQTPNGNVNVAAFNRTARYIRVQSAATGSLALAEVTPNAEPVELNQSPAISITAPVSGSQFNAPATFRIDTASSDSDGTVTKVDFYRGTTLMKTDTTLPFRFNVSNLPGGFPVGTHSLTARATDNEGAQTTSAPVSVTVNQP